MRVFHHNDVEGKIETALSERKYLHEQKKSEKNKEGAVLLNS